MGNVYLIGMMGSGKSVTGKKLAAMLGCEWVDADQVLEAKMGRSIPDIFEEEGEPYFRTREIEIIREITHGGPSVVATGGGAVLLSENVENMMRTGKIVYLETSPGVLWSRVKEKKNRPLLKHVRPQERLNQILDDRRPLYEKSCDFRVSTDGKSAEQVAAEIFEILKKQP